ncbi:MAG: major facilitator superfamily domain-containing protein [Benniella sp.]|nr:MAG: major facilitator superfamily domain-containing protein [Benniella sp.]
MTRHATDNTPSCPSPLPLATSSSPSVVDTLHHHDHSSSSPSTPSTPTDNTSTFYPEGEYGWLVLAGTFLIAFWALGVNFDWGVFTEFFDRTAPFHGADANHLSWVGAISSASLFIGGPAIVFFIHKLGSRAVLITGSLLMAAGYLLGSFANQHWHLYITNGFMFGFGGSLQYFTALNVLAGYFNKKRGLVVGIVVAGAGVGASVLAPLMRWMVSEIGFRWTFRIIGVCMLFFTGLATCFIRPYHPNSNPTTHPHDNHTTNLGSIEEKHPTTLPAAATSGETLVDNNMSRRSNSDISHASPTIVTSPKDPSAQQKPLDPGAHGSLDWTVLRVPEYALVFVGSILAAFAFMAPILMFPSYATSIGLSAADGATMLTITSSVNFIFRILMGYISDRYGVLNIAILCGMVAGCSCLFIWSQATSFVTLALFMVFYGAFAGPSIMLLPVAATRVIHPSRTSSALGFSFFAHSIGYILGAPMTQHIVQAQHGKYTAAILVLGLLDIVSAALLLVTRFLVDRRLWVAR